MTVPRDRARQVPVHLVRWGEGDGDLLAKLVGDPAMMEHLGGPESPEKIAERQARYVRMESGVYKVVEDASGEGVGWVGFWDSNWRNEAIYEMGWAVLPSHQGRGIATAATAQAIVLAMAEGKYRYAHAFPSVDNPASNGVCRKLGFTLVETCEGEYPPGTFIRVNDWRLDLRGEPGTA
ncbi:MAG TPA: GNAT family N-acetyltransferase [Thermomicrobiaceae bacterium]|nr:GNAT family N-acetyltransferase [Thermomicrobiaceae bacterium]